MARVVCHGPGMRNDVEVRLRPGDRERLEAVLADRNSPQKHVESRSDLAENAGQHQQAPGTRYANAVVTLCHFLHIWAGPALLTGPSGKDRSRYYARCRRIRSSR